jgi:valyl-tRNA synthetase
MISVTDKTTKGLVEDGKGYLVTLANLETVTVEVDLVEPKGVATGVIGSLRVFVPLSGIVDIAGEKTRLQKEIVKVKKDLEQSSKKLSNRDFMEKAAEAIIKKEEEKLNDSQERLAALETAENKLKDLEN